MSKLTHSDMPILRSCRETLRTMIDLANRQKAEETDVGMLIGYCTVIDQLHADFDRVGRQLSKLEKTGGAGRSPATDKGHGCPALLPAVGPAPADSAGGDITHSANRFLFAPAVKELPPVLSAAEASKIRSRA